MKGKAAGWGVAKLVHAIGGAPAYACVAYVGVAGGAVRYATGAMYVGVAWYITAGSDISLRSRIRV